MVIGLIGTTEIVVPSLSGDYFTWQLIDKTNLGEYLFYQGNTSSVSFYKKFIIDNNIGSIGLTAGIVQIPGGQYTYNLHQMINPYDLDLNNSLGVSRTGLITIGATYTPLIQYSSNDSFTFSSYTNLER